MTGVRVQPVPPRLLPVGAQQGAARAIVGMRADLARRLEDGDSDGTERVLAAIAACHTGARDSHDDD